jgi:hypothetical protein
LGELYGFGAPGLIAKRIGAVRAYFSAAPKLPAALVRSIAARAGVHIYNEQDDVTYVNRSFVGLHTPRSGQRTLRFPQPTNLYEVYSKEVVARNALEVTLDLPARHSALYFCGTEEEWTRREPAE